MQVKLRRRTKSRRWKLADEKREEIDAGNAEEKDEEPQVEAISEAVQAKLWNVGASRCRCPRCPTNNYHIQ